ncbi:MULTISPECIES: hypothetical protein [Acinetobacter]|uniref:hypothetical protein n=1 Tax=Acinetobacter TaxID=469 RepID=UPI00028CA43C|nr:hypothetical protein [Acinetobacter radioresistens]BBL22295.1 hypothetical protein ACRAD_29660 [Acinetobacter radioresistens DSM 6976 = NBRC 102413 = CIP 103788]
MNTVANNRKNLFTFIGLSLALLLAFGSVALSIHAQNKADKQARDAELEQIAMFYAHKQDLETCSNQTPDKAIRIESFNLLLQHTISQDVPVSTMVNMINKCKATLGL